ncbi:MAG: cell division protein FtsA [Methylacidiphilales bacterium]|nr:cell division protein FtsA [Candidatus Methylacidiphilales bacterium]MDW8349791.1 cell division protein FtsA [Verrucomicrobiae bacterium]
MFFIQSSRPIIVALDVGTRKVVAAIAECRLEEGSLRLLGLGEHPMYQMCKGQILDIKMVTQCIREALFEAETATDVAIREVYLAFSNPLTQSLNANVSIPILSHDRRRQNETFLPEILPQHVSQLNQKARELTPPKDTRLLHDVVRSYYNDNGAAVPRPVGLNSKKLSGAFHLIYANELQADTLVRAVQSLDVEITKLVAGTYATPFAVLTQQERKEGGIVVNLGGGVTEVSVFMDGGMIYSHVLGIGGDTLTQDIILAFKEHLPRFPINYALAEEIKKQYGAAAWNSAEEKQIITLRNPNDAQHTIKIKRLPIMQITQARMAETLEIILDLLQKEHFWPRFSGPLYFSGGSSKLPGISELASKIFPERIQPQLCRPLPFDGDQKLMHRPELATVFGTLAYAHRNEMRIYARRPLVRIRHSLKKMWADMKLFF